MKLSCLLSLLRSKDASVDEIEYCYLLDTAYETCIQCRSESELYQVSDVNSVMLKNMSKFVEIEEIELLIRKNNLTMAKEKFNLFLENQPSIKMLEALTSNLSLLAACPISFLFQLVQKIVFHYSQNCISDLSNLIPWIKCLIASSIVLNTEESHQLSVYAVEWIKEDLRSVSLLLPVPWLTHTHIYIHIHGLVFDVIELP